MTSFKKNVEVVRTCVITREKKAKKDLHKFILDEEQVVFDEYQKIQARSVYTVKEHQILVDFTEKKAKLKAKSHIGGQKLQALIKELIANNKL